jgi:lysozyme
MNKKLKLYEGGVRTLVKVKLNQNQYDALVSFTFNLGVGALQKSTLLKKLNAGDYLGAAAQFPRWVYANKQKLPGLVTRRNEEKKLFLS